MKTFWPILMLALVGCGKMNPFASEDAPPVYMGGRVVLINSDTHVPNAVVRFGKWANSCLTCPMSYIEVGTDTTDENGRFDIPEDTDATMAIAFGLDSIFSRPSTEGNVNSYLENGGELKLSLVPPAWLKVSATDAYPLNPEVWYVQGDTIIGSSNGIVNLSSPIVWKVDGGVSQYIKYQLVFTDETLGSVFNYTIPPPIPFDTTEYIIEY